jgi:hypothetical protein
MLSGKIPEWLGQLGGLKILGLAYNSFTGSIPTNFGNLSSLILETQEHKGKEYFHLIILLAIKLQRMYIYNKNAAVNSSANKCPAVKINSLIKIIN